MKTLALKDVEVHLGGVHILHDVTFEVDSGQVFGIVGPNGAGKTTILNVIGGVVRPTAGTVHYGDADLIGVRPYKMRELGIGRSLQSTHYFRDLTALQLVALAEAPNSVAGALRFGGHRLRSASKRAGGERLTSYSALDLMGLLDYANHPLSELSSAVQKLVDMCRAVVAGTDLLLLDEPTSGVSAHERGRIAAAINQLRDLGRTIVLIDHDPGFVTSNCDRLMAINYGEVLRIGTPDEVMGDELVKRAYLGVQADEDAASDAAAAAEVDPEHDAMAEFESEHSEEALEES